MLVDQKLLKQIGKFCPLSYAKFFGRKYHLPNYRQVDYSNLDYENLASFDRCLSLPVRGMDAADEVSRCAIINTFASLHYNRPTLFLERELGEALLRTDILSDLSTGDIRWRWPALKVVLPKNLISIKVKGEARSLTHFDVCQVDEEEGQHLPREIALELDKFLKWLDPQNHYRSTSEVHFVYPDTGVCIATALETSDEDEGQTLYSSVKPWGEIRIEDYRAIQKDLDSPFPQDAGDRALVQRLEHLVLNVLLFLSAAPLEYEAETILRKAKKEGSRVVPGLFAARFVGQVQLRAVHHQPKTAVELPQGTGRHLVSHWRSGHWKRQVFGVGRAERKLVWIQPYLTQEPPKPEGNA